MERRMKVFGEGGSQILCRQRKRRRAGGYDQMARKLGGKTWVVRLGVTDALLPCEVLGGRAGALGLWLCGLVAASPRCRRGGVCWLADSADLSPARSRKHGQLYLIFYSSKSESVCGRAAPRRAAPVGGCRVSSRAVHYDSDPALHLFFARPWGRLLLLCAWA